MQNFEEKDEDDEGVDAKASMTEETRSFYQNFAF